MQSISSFYEAHHLAATAAELAASGDIAGAIAQVEVAREMMPGDFSVGMACANAISDISLYLKNDTKKKSSYSEYGTVQYWFRKHYRQLIPGSELQLVRKGKYVPDFIVRKDGFDIPVECKKRFTARSLNQLKTYMDHFGSKTGYAVANSIHVDLPANIKFIECHAKTPQDADHLSPPMIGQAKRLGKEGEE